MRTADWTRNPKTRKSNDSELFLQMTSEVERLIRGDARNLIAGRVDETARLIMAQLAHVHGLSPKPPRKEA